MHQALIIYITLQSLLFSVVLIAGRKAENRPLAFYFSYLFLLHFFFMLCDRDSFITVYDDKLIRACYEFIALCNTAVVFFFLYSILEKPMPKALHLLWLIPVLHLLADYALKTIYKDLYFAGFYKNWYLNFPFYIKILFTGLLIWQIKVFKKEISKNSSSKKHHQLIKLYWGKYFIYFHLILSSLLLLYLLFTLANGRLYQVDLPQFTYSAHYYNWINRGCTAFFILVFGYLALRNPAVFNVTSTNLHFEQKIIEIILPEEEKNLQKKIELTDEQLKQYSLVINKLMEEDQIYLDPELSLSKLSRLSHIPSRQLSQYIKITFNKNYKEYINNHRIIYAQELLTRQNAPADTIYSIALDSGFNSESTFYQVFKQQTNLTPKQYQDKFKSRL